MPSSPRLAAAHLAARANPMRTWLIILSVVEILIFVSALSYYLIRISKSLTNASTFLAKVTFGVRAIETQTSSIGPSVVKVNGQLATIAGALDGIASQAEALGQSS